MRPLNSDKRTGLAESASAGVRHSDHSGSTYRMSRVLFDAPRRLLRKTQASFDLYNGGTKRFTKGLGAALILAIAGYVTVEESKFAATLFEKAGFSAKSLVVNGNIEVDATGVEYALSPQLQNSMFTFDTRVAREELLKNPWLKSANVRKVYPSTVVVSVVERQPFAFWKASDIFTVIARDGVVLGEASPEHMRLPQVVGTGANLAASEFVSEVARFPKIVDRAGAFVRVADRRWNIVLKDGIKILLPEYGWKESLIELSSLQAKQGILDRELVQIDMRLPDRMVLRLDQDDARQRREYLENILKRDWHRT